MAKRSPKLTTTKVLQIRWSWRTSRRPYAPTPTDVAPLCPRWMDTESRQLWHKVTDDLHDLEILARIDSPTLVRYVSMLAQWQRLAQFLQEHGETYEVRHSYRVPERTNADGEIIPRHTVDTVRHELRPQAKLALALADRLLRLERQFGMTPNGCTGIGAALSAARKATSGHPLTLDPRRFLRLERPK